MTWLLPSGGWAPGSLLSGVRIPAPTCRHGHQEAPLCSYGSSSWAKVFRPALSGRASESCQGLWNGKGLERLCCPETGWAEADFGNRREPQRFWRATEGRCYQKYASSSRRASTRLVPGPRQAGVGARSLYPWRTLAVATCPHGHGRICPRMFYRDLPLTLLSLKGRTYWGQTSFLPSLAGCTHTAP